MTQAEPPHPPPPSGHPLTNGGAPSALGRGPLFLDARYLDGDAHQLQVRAEASRPGWYAAKAPWASRPGYRGWALIRISRLDGPGQAQVELQLADGDVAGDAIGVNVQADWQFWPGSTEVTTAGCYGIQVDGSAFTEVIVLRAEVAA